VKQVSRREVEKAFEKVAKAQPRALSKLIESMAKEQPNICAYLLDSAQEDELNNNEESFLLFLAAVIWQAMSYGPSPEISDDVVDLVIEEQGKLEEYIEREQQTGFSFTSSIIMDSYHQKEALDVITGAVLDLEELGKIRHDSGTAMMLHLMTTISCFDRQPEVQA